MYLNYAGLIQCGRNSGGSAKGSKGGSRKAGGGAPRTAEQVSDNDIADAMKEIAPNMEEPFMSLYDLKQKLNMPQDEFAKRLTQAQYDGLVYLQTGDAGAKPTPEGRQERANILSAAFDIPYRRGGVAFVSLNKK